MKLKYITFLAGRFALYEGLSHGDKRDAITLFFYSI